MSRIKFLALLSLLSGCAFSQNDQDAIRYSRPGVNGTSRFAAMGGAFGAIGADLTSAAYNPAGLGLFRKGEINFSGGLKFTNNSASIYNNSSSVLDAKFVFNNFGIAFAWNATKDPESRNVLAFTNTQLQNFSNSTRMSGYTNNSSIAKDMLTLANEDKIVDNLTGSYEWLGFDALVLDTVNGKFISLLDTKRTVSQTRDVVTTGKMNEVNISYAYAYKDQYYLGVSLGLPRVEYVSTTTHTERDDKDSMRVAFGPSGQTDTFVDGLPTLNSYYTSVLAFNSLTYTEYFKTTGSGVNLKIGGVARVSDALRLGIYFHTPTLYNLTDTYYNTMSATFDASPTKSYDSKFPADGGIFKYRIITPGRLSLNAAYIIKKLAVIGLDYEYVNYQRAQLSSDNIGDFAYVNNLIKSKYKGGHVIRLGGELNIKPVMIRAGYIMQGSPFGDNFSGSFVRHTFSAGVGIRTKNRWYLDFVLAKSVSTEDYFLFTTLTTKAQLNLSSTMFGATVGIKF